MLRLFYRLLLFMRDENKSIQLRTECAVVLGSLAKGTNENIHTIIQEGSFPVLVQGTLILIFFCICYPFIFIYVGLTCPPYILGINEPYLQYVEACLRCLRTLLTSSVACKGMLYEEASVIPLMIQIMSHSHSTQESITSILAECCQTVDQQAMLCYHGAIDALVPLLLENIPKVLIYLIICISGKDR